MIDYPNDLNIIFDKLEKNGIIPIIVGGFVRDQIFHEFYTKEAYTAKDIDIELYNAPSFEKIQNILLEFGNPNIIGKSFGVIKLNYHNLDIDFSLPRSENKIKAGHKGFEIKTHSKIDYKLASLRRDFTINSIGYDVLNKKILDPYNGLNDIKNRTLRFINKNTFMQDPLRVLRAMQFCARFDLVGDVDLIDTCRSMCQMDLLNELAKERIYEEFKKLFLKAINPSVGLIFLKKIDGFVFFNELNFSLKEWDNTLKLLDNMDRSTLKDDHNMLIMLAILCYKMDKPSQISFINKLTNKKNMLKSIYSLYHVESFLHHQNPLSCDIVKTINFTLLNVYLKSKNFTHTTIEKIKKIKPLVQGEDLIKIGMKPSKEFKVILQMVYEVQINKIFN